MAHNKFDKEIITQFTSMAIKVIHLKPEFVDFRGAITRIINEPKIKIQAVLLLTHKKGSIRGNHYHKKDSHWVYCVSGKFKYYENNQIQLQKIYQPDFYHPGRFAFGCLYFRLY